jgi:hypothetical protein
VRHKRLVEALDARLDGLELGLDDEQERAPLLLARLGPLLALGVTNSSSFSRASSR